MADILTFKSTLKFAHYFVIYCAWSEPVLSHLEFLHEQLFAVIGQSEVRLYLNIPPSPLKLFTWSGWSNFGDVYSPILDPKTEDLCSSAKVDLYFT